MKRRGKLRKGMMAGAIVALSFAEAPRAAAQSPKPPQDVHVVNAATDPVSVKIGHLVDIS